jgi:hypothetical protein
VVPVHLIELGQQALASVATNVAGGAPLVRCQLLASEFYEVLKRELRATSELGAVERGMVAAATGLCRHAATASAVQTAHQFPRREYGHQPIAK